MEGQVDISEFESKILLRNIAAGDFDEIVALQRKCFGRMAPWTREQFDSQLELFPEGQFCIVIDGQIAASATSLIVDFDLYSEWHNWREISDGGMIRNHDPNGDTLYGIEIMVDPEFRGMKLARRLYQARKDLVRERNLKSIVIGGRIPGYREHKDTMTAHEYAEDVEDKTLYDPVLTTQLANGFELKRLIPDYMPSDEDSVGWATYLEWTNVDYRPYKKRAIRPVQVVRIAAVQYQMRAIENFGEFQRQCAFFVDTASDYKSDFVLFPELITTQLLSFCDTKRPGDAARKLAEFTPQYLEMFSEFAIRYNINIIGGSQFEVLDNTLYNVAYFFGRDGAIGRQRKIHVTPAEWKWWGVNGGDKVEVFDTDCGRIAVMICYDIEFPEISRIAAQKGAQIFFVPFNTDERHGYLRVRHCALARSIENHVYVAVAGCVGNLPFVNNADIHYAQSGIFTPADFSFSRDCVAAECNPNIETFVIQDVDIELLRRHRYRGTTQNWNDRRKDIYEIRYTESGETRTV
jgi:predicted amidohydrolase/ribosomal protein S18 acetylase RimI-like enzyme